MLHDAAIIGDSLISGRWESERERVMVYDIFPRPHALAIYLGFTSSDREADKQ